MTLNEILERVHNAYPDGTTRDCWDAQRGRPCSGSGDTLAEFVVREIADTYDAEASHSEQLTEAIRVLERARSDIKHVLRALRQVQARPEPEKTYPIINESDPHHIFTVQGTTVESAALSALETLGWLMGKAEESED